MHQVLAAVYARKSTEQSVTDDQKSIARQIDHARAYAASKGWAVPDAHVYADDGISGAEFANRPGFLRLMNAVKPKAPFQVLVMSEESRLGREAIETAFALKQLIQAGVRVFFYLEDRERTLDSPTDKIMLSLTTFADELEREKARQRTYDAMQRKARAGHVTGGRTFGYDNVTISGADGQRSHVERRINENEAAVVREIFRLCAEGVGQTRIARHLNAHGRPAPRPQRGRPAAWAPSSVHEVLFRDLYRGLIVWNRSKKRNRWGQHQQTDRPAGDWITVPAPHLRIIPEGDWLAAHQRIESARTEYARTTRGCRRVVRRDRESKYLLVGFARCALCGGGLHVRSHKSGTRRAFSYACTSHYAKGPTVCPHVERWPMADLDREVLAAVMGDVLSPHLVDAVVEQARQMHAAVASGDEGSDREARTELEKVQREQARLTDAIAAGGHFPALLRRLEETERRRLDLTSRLQMSAAPGTLPAWRDVERRVRESLIDWRSTLLGDDVAGARQAFRQLLTTPIVCTPFVQGSRRTLTFEGKVGLEAVFGGDLVTKLASPPGFEPGFWP